MILLLFFIIAHWCNNNMRTCVYKLLRTHKHTHARVHTIIYAFRMYEILLLRKRKN